MLETDDRYQWPVEIRELYVTDVFTNIEKEITSEVKLWSWVDFCGVGHLIYDVY